MIVCNKFALLFQMENLIKRLKFFIKVDYIACTTFIARG